MLVFTGDGVGVGVVIRSAERYDLVKIKLLESEAPVKTALSESEAEAEE